MILHVFIACTYAHTLGNNNSAIQEKFMGKCIAQKLIYDALCLIILLNLPGRAAHGALHKVFQHFLISRETALLHCFLTCVLCACNIRYDVLYIHNQNYDIRESMKCEFPPLGTYNI